MMVSKKKILRWVGALTLICGITYFWGLAWRKEWDTRSGKARIVQSVYGIDCSISSESETILSRWLDHDSEEENWVKVASGPTHFTLVSYLFFSVESALLRAEFFLTSGSIRKECASHILMKLAETENIGEVYDYVSHVVQGIEDGRWGGSVEWWDSDRDETEVEQIRRILKEASTQ